MSSSAAQRLVARSSDATLMLSSAGSVHHQASIRVPPGVLTGSVGAIHVSCHSSHLHHASPVFLSSSIASSLVRLIRLSSLSPVPGLSHVQCSVTFVESAVFQSPSSFNCPVLLAPPSCLPAASSAVPLVFRCFCGARSGLFRLPPSAVPSASPASILSSGDNV